MFGGSLTISRSTPFAAMALRVLASRSAYSCRVNFKFGWTTMHASFASALESRSRLGRVGAVARQVGDGGVLDAGPGQVGHGDRFGIAAAALLPGDDLAQLGETRLGAHQSGCDTVLQLPQPSRLLQTVRDVEIGLDRNERL